LAPDLWQKKQAIVEEARRAVTEQY
jgi:hypothetical protein